MLNVLAFMLWCIWFHFLRWSCFFFSWRFWNLLRDSVVVSWRTQDVRETSWTVWTGLDIFLLGEWGCRLSAGRMKDRLYLHSPAVRTPQTWPSLYRCTASHSFIFTTRRLTFAMKRSCSFYFYKTDVFPIDLLHLKKLNKLLLWMKTTCMNLVKTK